MAPIVSYLSKSFCLSAVDVWPAYRENKLYLALSLLFLLSNMMHYVHYCADKMCLPFCVILYLCTLLRCPVDHIFKPKWLNYSRGISHWENLRCLYYCNKFFVCVYIYIITVIKDVLIYYINIYYMIYSTHTHIYVCIQWNCVCKHVLLLFWYLTGLCTTPSMML